MKITFTVLFIILTFGTFSASAADRVLIVGVDVYTDQRLMPTEGSSDDARAIQRLLIEKFRFAPGSIKLLLNEQATAANIVRDFQTWLINGTRPGDRAFFYYAGHGSQVPDDNSDEADMLDEVITPFDVAVALKNNRVVLTDEKTFIRDDQINDFIAQLSGRRAVLMFDSCNSGTISRGLTDNSKLLPSRYLRLKPSRSISDGRGYSDVPAIGKPRDLTHIGEDELNGNVNGVVILSAASPYQQAFPFITGENKIRGAFTYIFENLLWNNQTKDLENLEQDLQREMKNLADKGMIGKGQNGEYQVPQVEIISKTKIADKPLFSESTPGESFTAAVESALFNPLSTMSVRLSLDKRRYKLGDPIKYTVDVSETSFLYILVFSTQNRAFCIFPTSAGGDPANKMLKGTHSFPRDNYETVATEPTGKDVWVALISRKELRLGEKEEYTWDEMFDRIGLAELQKAIAEKVAKLRGAGNKRNVPLTADDWQADAVVVETVGN